mmetsp:Transcript_25088/g.37905  ORF Transcript_25088/g.37905 Transcript_25088/m.37905 type:complete len:433 (+) Transcript_25088:160-1458(+)
MIRRVLLSSLFVPRGRISVVSIRSFTATPDAARNSNGNHNNNYNNDNNTNQQWMIQQFGCTKAKIERQLTKNALNKIYPVTLKERVNWLQQRLGLKEEELKKLLQNHPFILKYQSKENLEPTLTYLQDRLSLDDSELLRLVQRAPPILGLSEDKLQHKIQYLKEQLNSNYEVIGKLLVRAPTILQMNLESNLKHKLEFIKTRLDLDQKQLADLIGKAPSILNMSIENKIAPVLYWFQQRLGLTDQQLSKIVSKSPTMLNKKQSNLAPLLDWFEERLLMKTEDSPSELATLIENHPPLLGLSIESNLELKLDFCINILKEHNNTTISDDYQSSTKDSPLLRTNLCLTGDKNKSAANDNNNNEAQAVALLKKNPRILSASLEKRLKLRLEEAQNAGIVINQQTLLRMAKLTNDKWKVSLKFQSQKQKGTDCKNS